MWPSQLYQRNIEVLCWDIKCLQLQILGYCLETPQPIGAEWHEVYNGSFSRLFFAKKLQRLASTSSIPKWFIVKVCPMTTCRINRGNTTSFGDSCALSFQQSYISQVLYKPKWILYFYIGKLGQHWKIHNFSRVSYFWVFLFHIFLVQKHNIGIFVFKNTVTLSSFYSKLWQFSILHHYLTLFWCQLMYYLKWTDFSVHNKKLVNIKAHKA